jgi:toxin ParE1/3/4
MRVILVPEARKELQEATAWYTTRSRVAARRFIDEYTRVKGLAAHAPLQWVEIQPGVRRVLFKKFPFALIYTVEGSQIHVLAIKHHKQHPDHWRGR